MQKSKLIFVLWLAIAPCLCFCQNLLSPKSIDSLQTILKTARQDTFQLKVLHQLGNYYFLRRFKANTPDLDTALFYFNREVILGKKINIDNGSGWPEALCNIGEIYLAKNKLPQAKARFTEAFNRYQQIGDKKMAGKTWVRFGRVASEIFWYSRPGNLLDEILTAYRIAIDIFTATGDAGDEISVYTNTAAVYFVYGEYDHAEAACMKAIKKYQGKLYPELVRLYYVLAHVQRYHGNLNKSLTYVLESLRILEKNPETKDKVTTQSMLFGEIALIYDALGQTENSIVWYKRTLALRENMHIKLEFKYRTAGFIVQGLIKQKKFNEAFSTALGVEKRHPPDNDYDKAIISQIKAYCYDAMGDYNKAEELYLLALKLFGNLMTDEIVSLAKYDVAKFYIKMKEYKKAAFYLNEGVTSGMAVTRLKDWHFIYYKIDSADQNYLSALQHHIQFKTFNDSLFNIEKNKQLQQLQIQYETEQKESDIRLLIKDSVFEHEKTTQANNIRNLTLAGSVLLIILLALIFSNYRVKQRSNVALNALLNEKDNLLKEKEWLIKEIHHRVKNNLQIVMGLLQRQSAYINDEVALQAIQNSEGRMHSIALIHQKLYQSENLDLIGMPEYINEMITYLRDSFDLNNRIVFEKHVDDISLDVAQAVPLGLILNEAVTNAIKYAYKPGESGVIYITLVKNNEDYNQLTIADNGPGLSAEFDLNKVDSLGINLMRGLSRQLGGSFEISSEQGCAIYITFKTEIFTKA